jgi:DeoR family suf operon transcriptional repressor
MAEFHSINPDRRDANSMTLGTLDNSVLSQISNEVKNGNTHDDIAVESTVSGECFILTEYNCAISHIAESYPSVCGHELEMFAVALPDCTVQRTHWLVNGEHRCGYLIQPKE